MKESIQTIAQSLYRIFSGGAGNDQDFSLMEFLKNLIVIIYNGSKLCIERVRVYIIDVSL